jgi:hypothetical protein
MVTTNDSKPVDARVDAAFGEPVVLKPMMVQQSGYRETVPDPSRPQVVAVGIYYQERGGVEHQDGGFSHSSNISDTMLSIRFEPVEQCNLRKGDRVFFPDRNEWHEVSYVDDEPSGRWDIHILKVIEPVGP